MQIKPIFLAILSGLLLWLGFPPNHFPGFMFVAFVPLLWLMQHYVNQEVPNYRAIFLHSSLAIFIWNVLSLNWIKNAAWIGFVAPTIFHTLAMSLMIYVSAKLFKRFGARFVWLCLPAFWLSFEYFHLRWDLDFPWLNLGNAFAGFPLWVQWYQFVGQAGGTLWIWWVNISIWILWITITNKESKYYKILLFKKALNSLALITLPLLVSYYLYLKPIPAGTPIEAVIVQPSYDPYGLKFDRDTYQSQMDTLIALSLQAATPNTKLIVWPETSLPDFYRLEPEAYNWQDAALQPLWDSLPSVSLIAGASAVEVIDSSNAVPFVSKATPDGRFINYYNAALHFSYGSLQATYFKTKLVSGVEKMPFAAVLAPLGNAIVDLGGTSHILGTQTDRTNFTKQPMVIAPVICYESVFPEFVSRYAANQANLIAIITNDGWWGKTAGYQQHLVFAGLRAIENGRFVVRSANTGISGIFNPKGELIQKTEWCQQTAFKAMISLQNHQTFYVTYGDTVGRTSLFVTGLLALMLVLPNKKFN